MLEKKGTDINRNNNFNPSCVFIIVYLFGAPPTSPPATMPGLCAGGGGGVV